ncbi:MAG: hypothetical protein ACI9ZF_003566 [Bradyrhizobium sp.]|jgi:hypothetical protein
MFRIIGKPVIRLGVKFGADLAQGALEDQAKSQFGMKYGLSGKPNAGGAAAAILRARYASQAEARAPAPSRIASPPAPALVLFTDKFNEKK